MLIHSYIGLLLFEDKKRDDVMFKVKLYLLCGKARNGKDTFGKFIEEYLVENGYNVCNIEIMRTLKGYVKDYFDWDGREESKPRELLQKFGTEIIREKLNKPYFHIDRLTEDIEVLSTYFDTFIVDDVRFPVEIEELRKRFDDVTVIHISRDDVIDNMTSEEKLHISETALDNYDNYDYKVKNNSTLEELKNKAKQIVSEGGLI